VLSEHDRRSAVGRPADLDERFGEQLLPRARERELSLQLFALRRDGRALGLPRAISTSSSSSTTGALCRSSSST
jgi:hypothetical protein